MVRTAEPAHFKRLGIIVMMGVEASYTVFAAYLAGLMLQFTAADSALNARCCAPALYAEGSGVAPEISAFLGYYAFAGAIDTATVRVVEFVIALTADLGRHGDFRLRRKSVKHAFTCLSSGASRLF